MKSVSGSFSSLELSLIDTSSLASQSTVFLYHLFWKKSFFWTAYLPLEASYGNQLFQSLFFIYFLSLSAYLFTLFRRPHLQITLVILILTFALFCVSLYQGDPLRSYQVGSPSSVVLALGTLVLFLLRLWLGNLLG
jgi:hypothetical protein